MTPQDITLMICGPLHPCGLENIPYYLCKSVKVIYSTWKPKNKTEHDLLEKVRTMLPEENIVVSEYMDVSTFDNIHNIYYQTWTWSEAVKICKTQYCIKIRSNCKFSNIDPLLDRIRRKRNKVVCISAFFRPCDRYYFIYCPSDFIICMKRKAASEITKKLLNDLQVVRAHLHPEQKICLATLAYYGLVPDMRNLQVAHEQMRTIYTIVNVNDLEPTMYWDNKGPYLNFDHNQSTWHLSIFSIDDDEIDTDTTNPRIIPSEDITLMICGPLHPCGAENIPYYLSKSVKVVYSTLTPRNQTESDLLEKVKTMLPEENIVVSEYMDVSKVDNTQNVYYQVWTWLQAANICKTQYCVKIRSDCKFDYIDPLIAAIKNNPEKVIAISAFFRPCEYYYCASDFVIGTTTYEARIVCHKLLESFRAAILHMTPAERKICLAILSVRCIVPATDGPTAKLQMRTNYYIVDVNELKPKMYWHNIGPFFSFNPGHYGCIRSIDEF